MVVVAHTATVIRIVQVGKRAIITIVSQVRRATIITPVHLDNTANMATVRKMAQVEADQARTATAIRTFAQLVNLVIT
jgi:hypothetical protein